MKENFFTLNQKEKWLSLRANWSTINTFFLLQMEEKKIMRQNQKKKFFFLDRFT